MSYSMEYPLIAAEAPAEARAAFIRRTYGHLAGAVLAFIALEAALLQIPGLGELSLQLFSGYTWLLVLGAFIGVSYLANKWAMSDQSVGMQYLGLALYVVAQSVIFLPLLYLANTLAEGAITSAAIMTFMVFAGLSITVLVTRRDFSYLAPILSIGSLLALGFIVIAMFIPGVNMLGTVFCFAMVALASGYIIYYTSNIVHHYRTDQHVAAALALFAAVMLLFWYILQIFLMRSRD